LAASLGGACAGSAAADKQRFCELRREADRKGVDIDFEKASRAQIKANFSKFVASVRDNVAESKRVAPKEIRADFEKAVEVTREVARTGDIGPFMQSKATRHVGEYVAKECGIKGP
jgi:hypothetical protein